MSIKKCRIVATLILSVMVLLVVPLLAEGQVSKPKVEYTVTNQFPLEGGFERVIYISPKNRNEADLKSLGDTLRVDTRNEGFADVHIYDDEKAARMTKRDDL